MIRLFYKTTVTTMDQYVTNVSYYRNMAIYYTCVRKHILMLSIYKVLRKHLQRAVQDSPLLVQLQA